MTPGALSCRQDRSPASRRRSQWNPGKNITSRKVYLQLKNAERAVACAALRTAFQNMDPEKEVFLSSEQTMCGKDNAAPALRSKVHPAAVLMQYTLRPVRSQSNHDIRFPGAQLLGSLAVREAVDGGSSVA
ncbi:hypothetical protein Bbelb_097210 [Branchiostoma belcheri]|nr:hypothetical protein Bbelb_097210 [Branchiostoma belcheri]